jgi:hypothetical protein
MEGIKFDISRLSEERVVVEVSYSGESLGILYFEKPKRGWTNKPVLPTRWACVDAKVEGLYIHNKNGGNNITPKQIIAHSQELISSF